jgi:DNA-binding response OmpR family regulator
MDSRLQGKRILIVEDDFLLATDTKKLLERQETVVVGPVRTVEAALSLIAVVEIDAAILDIELHEYDGFAVADVLMRRGIPFVSRLE